MTMKKTIVLFIVGMMLFLTKVHAQDSGTGVGVILGSPTGISAKGWLTKTNAWAAAAAWNINGPGYLHVHADYLVHNFDLINATTGTLAPYFGLGAGLWFSSNTTIFARVPLGLDYMFENAPLDIFLEVAPSLSVLPSTSFGVGGGLGVRYFF